MIKLLVFVFGTLFTFTSFASQNSFEAYKSKIINKLEWLKVGMEQRHDAKIDAIIRFVDICTLEDYELFKEINVEEIIRDAVKTFVRREKERVERLKAPLFSPEDAIDIKKDREANEILVKKFNRRS